jgi:hypothetical protein
MGNLCVFDLADFFDGVGYVWVLFDDDGEHGGYTDEVEEKETSQFGIDLHHVL